MKNWQGILDKLHAKISNWAFRALNIAGRIVLVKSVLQAIPIYSLSIMAAPLRVCAKIREIIRNFIWRGSDQKKKWALVSWEQLTKRKERGGLGLRDPETLNRVLGAKFWWRWLRAGNDLWKKIWRTKYNMPNSTLEILRQQITPKGSSIWDLACLNRDLVEQQAFWEIRGGAEANFWEDRWQQRERLSRIPYLHQIQTKIEGNKTCVRDYWRAQLAEEGWRVWIDPMEWDKEIDHDTQDNYKK